MIGNTEEIRINNAYASKITANYPQDESKDSTPIIRHKHLRTDIYVNKVLEKISPFTSKSHLIPLNCRFLKSYSKYVLCVIEEPPAMRSIRVDMDMYRECEALKATGQWDEFELENFFEENLRPYTFMVATPYVIHILLFAVSNFSLQIGRLGFRTKPLLGLGDELYRPPLLNVSSNLSICYGNTISKGPRTSISREVDHVLKSFWGSTFNPDYIDNYHKYMNTAGLNSYFVWQHYSQTNPMFIYNADWIPYTKRLGEIIDRIESANGLTKQTFGYKTLSDLFSRPSSTGRTISTKSSPIKRRLMYDICDGWHPEGTLSVNIGDAFKFNKDGDLAFIDSYMAAEGSLGPPQFVRIVLPNGKLSIMKINSRVESYIVEKIKELRYEAKLELPSKGKKKEYIQAGDIVEMENKFGNKVFKKVHYIRKTADDRLEVRFGSEFYFADAIEWDKVSKIDVSEPEINGIKISADSEYYYIAGRYIPSAPIANIVPVRFNEITAGHNNTLVAKFIGSRQYNVKKEYTFNLGNKSTEAKKLFSRSEMEKIPTVFFVGRRMFSVVGDLGKCHTPYKHPNSGILIPGNCRKRNVFFDDVKKECISKDGSHFHIESHNLDIDFHIGDKVITADWKEPLKMLTVRTIQGFKVDDKSKTINFILEDKHGALTEELYVNADNSTIQVGKIRKVANQIDKISAGTKIKAKVAGISCFPKKDVNIIVAFIIDTAGEPLVLCSNGCTLWYTDLLEKFTKITMKSKKWATIEHAPLDPSKIKLQTGDIITGTRMFRDTCGYMVVKNRTNRGIRAIPLIYYGDYDEYYSFDKSFCQDVILDCIPNPRLTVPQQEELGSVRGFPTFHGLIYESHYSHSPYNFINEPGRIIPNV